MRHAVPRLAVICCLLLAVPSIALASAAGDLDPTFGGGGVREVTFGPGTSLGTSITRSPDGRIVAAGYSGTSGRVLAARFRQGGALDTTFGGDGRVSLRMPIFEVTDVEAQSDGKVILLANGLDGARVIRLRRDGSLDMTFSKDGWALVSVGSKAMAEALFDAAITPTGQIVAVGRAWNETVGASKVLTVRLRTDGRFDHGFDEDGILTDELGTKVDWGQGVALRSDGTIVVAGRVGTIDNADPIVIRYLPDGTRDVRFGDAGLVRERGFPASAAYSSVAVLANDSLLVGGFTLDSGSDVWALGRYAGSGRLVESFDDDGLATIDFLEFGHVAEVAQVAGLAVDADRRYVVVGGAGDLAGLARLKPNGALDPTFGTGGKVATSVGATQARGEGVMLQDDGRIVMVGSAYTFPDPIHLAVARFLAAGSA